MRLIRKAPAVIVHRPPTHLRPFPRPNGGLVRFNLARAMRKRQAAAVKWRVRVGSLDLIYLGDPNRTSGALATAAQLAGGVDAWGYVTPAGVARNGAMVAPWDAIDWIGPIVT